MFVISVLGLEGVVFDSETLLEIRGGNVFTV